MALVHVSVIAPITRKSYVHAFIIKYIPKVNYTYPIATVTLAHHNQPLVTVAKQQHEKSHEGNGSYGIDFRHMHSQ